MPSTHLSLHYHLIFSTKDRVALMHKDWRSRLHAYMGGIVNDLGGVPETIGGVEDHVHLLIGLLLIGLRDSLPRRRVERDQILILKMGAPGTQKAIVFLAGRIRRFHRRHLADCDSEKLHR